MNPAYPTLCSTVCYCSLPNILSGISSVSLDCEKLLGEMISNQCKLILHTSKWKLQVSVANQQDEVLSSSDNMYQYEQADEYIKYSVHDNTVNFSHKLGPILTICRLLTFLKLLGIFYKFNLNRFLCFFLPESCFCPWIPSQECWY